MLKALKVVARTYLMLLGGSRRAYILSIMIDMILQALAAGIFPLLVKAIWDGASSRIEFAHFIVITSAYLFFGILVTISSYRVVLRRMELNNDVIRYVSERMLYAYYQKDYRDVLRNGHGYYVARIRSDVNDGLLPLLELVRKMSINVGRSIALITVIIFLSWKIFLILLAIIPISTVVSLSVGKKIKRITTIERQYEGRVLASLTQCIDAFLMVNTFGMTQSVVQAFDNRMRLVISSGYKKRAIVERLRSIDNGTIVIADSSALFVGSFFVFKGLMTIGSFLAFANSFWQVVQNVMSLFKDWAQLQSYSAMASRLEQFINGEECNTFAPHGPDISLDNVTFGYGSKPVFSGINIHIRQAQSALILGPNGCGKTTLANVLAGHLRPTSGRAVLPQRISSITLPIAFPPIRIKDLPVDKTLLTRFKIDSKEALNSYGGQLSAGQQQKLALAIALSQDSDAFVLDEPLSNVDDQSRRDLMQAVFERTKNKILIVIMHNAEDFIDSFDQVIRFQKEESKLKHAVGMV